MIFACHPSSASYYLFGRLAHLELILCERIQNFLLESGLDMMACPGKPSKYRFFFNNISMSCHVFTLSERLLNNFITRSYRLHSIGRDGGMRPLDLLTPGKVFVACRNQRFGQYSFRAWSSTDRRRFPLPFRQLFCQERLR